MNKTLKIARPKFPRNKKGPSGRVEHDDRGNAIWTRTRAEDSASQFEIPALSIAIDLPDKPTQRGGKSRF